MLALLEWNSSQAVDSNRKGHKHRIVVIIGVTHHRQRIAQPVQYLFIHSLCGLQSDATDLCKSAENKTHHGIRTFAPPNYYIIRIIIIIIINTAGVYYIVEIPHSEIVVYNLN